MATKGRKSSEKKSGKKSEDPSILDDKTDDETEQSHADVTPSETEQDCADEPPKEPTPEPVYDEPTLTGLIVESYDGELVKGLYEGEATADFTGGHNYTGMFMEGMMHGQGIYKWADGVCYQGEFTNNQITGTGRYTWTDGSSYEGDVLKCMRHGVGTHTLADKKSYSGDWCQGHRHGRGKMTYDHDGRSYYEGDWVHNIRRGFGIRVYPSGNKYEGMWFNNVRHGRGTMGWGTDQLYSGQWQDGIQHGVGKHIWFLRRTAGSQYPLRNMYEGDFVHGMRHGSGRFLYANGAAYDGEWQDNMKCGHGKFTFKNGRIYEGQFERDHIAEFPSFTVDGNVTPDPDQIRTRTPLPQENMSTYSTMSQNTMSPTLQLDLGNLLSEFTEIDREEELQQVLFVIMRHMTNLKRVYNYYSGLGTKANESLIGGLGSRNEDSIADNTAVMSRMQFWQMMKDCQFHHQVALMALDRALGVTSHDPNEEILMRDFLNNMVTLAFEMYRNEHEGTGPLLAWCLSRLMCDNILPNACHVIGNFFYDHERASHALIHAQPAFDVYRTHSRPRKIPKRINPDSLHTAGLQDSTLRMREFLYMMKDYKLINNDLTTKHILDILSANDPSVSDGEGAFNMELEMTFLEFFEALIGCAQVYVTESVVKDPTTPRPSTTLTQEQSMLSIPLSPGRGGSQTGLDDGEDNHSDKDSQHNGGSGAASPDGGALSQQSEAAVQRQGSSKHAHETHLSNGTTSAIPSDSAARPVASQAGSVRNVQSEASHGAVKKSASHASARSHGDDAPGVESMESVVTADRGDEDGTARDEEIAVEDQLDDETKAFNFWTHQIHIFFVRKFFPAAEQRSMLDQRVQDRLRSQARICPVHGQLD